MALEIPKQRYSGTIKEIPVGKEGNQLVVGGETAFPFYFFEGEMPNRPRIAMEVYDEKPEEWAPVVMEPFADVLDDPVAWAKLNVEKYNAEIIALQLVSIDPNGTNASAESAAETAQKVADAVDVPVMALGVNNVEKDMEVLRLIAEKCEGRNLIIGPVTEGNHKQIGAPCIGYKHTVMASTPIDVNLAKQLNILLTTLGVKEDKLIIDPTTGALGYGMEYCYTVMERIRMAAIASNDTQLQYPFFSNVGKEVCKTKEAKLGDDDARYGDPATRGIIMECVTAVCLLLAGSDIISVRHPKTVEMLNKYLDFFLA